MKLPEFMQTRRLFTLLVLTISMQAAHAATPIPFIAEYEASYSGFKASAERALKVRGNGIVEMTTILKLKLLGQTVSSITEQSILFNDKDEDQLNPVDYSFIQTGIGKRRRHISFDWESGVAITDDGSNKREIPIQNFVADNLSSYLEVRKQLLDGKQDIAFPIIEKESIEEFKFKVLGEEKITTSLGTFNTLKLVREREPDSKRSTEIWLGLDWNYLLIKLVQDEHGSSSISLDLKQAVVEGRNVEGKNVDGEAVKDRTQSKAQELPAN